MKRLTAILLFTLAAAFTTPMAAQAPKVGDKFGDFPSILRLDDLDLLVVIEVGKDFLADRRFRESQDFPCFFGSQAFHELRGAARVERRAELAQLRLIQLVEHLAQLGQVERVNHGSRTAGSRTPSGATVLGVDGAEGLNPNTDWAKKS